MPFLTSIFISVTYWAPFLGCCWSIALRCVALHTSVVVCACVLACLVSMLGKEARDTDSTCPTIGKKGKQSQLSNMYPAYPLDVIRFGETKVRVRGIRVNACG